MRKQLQQENKIQGSYQYKNSGQYINVKIDDIPYTSMEVSEFKQMNGTDKVIVSVVLLVLKLDQFVLNKVKTLFYLLVVLPIILIL